MAEFPRCARCDGFLPAWGAQVCRNCGSSLTGVRCKSCDRVGGWDFVNGLCGNCFTRAGAPGASAAAAKSGKTDVCKRCGNIKPEDDYTCPFCGHTQWIDVVAIFFWAVIAFGVAVAGSQIGEPLWRYVAMIGGAIVGLFVLAVTANEVLAHFRWQPRGVPAEPAESAEPAAAPLDPFAALEALDDVDEEDEEADVDEEDKNPWAIEAGAPNPFDPWAPR